MDKANHDNNDEKTRERIQRREQLVAQELICLGLNARVAKLDAQILLPIAEREHEREKANISSVNNLEINTSVKQNTNDLVQKQLNQKQKK